MEQNIEIIDYFSHQRLKVTGDIFQFYRYAKDFRVGKRRFLRIDKNQDKIINEEDVLTEEEIRLKSYYRAKTILVDLINTNINAYTDNNGHYYPPVFLTLTFEENITDIPRANYLFTKFIKRLTYQIFKNKISKLKYVTVIEFQKRGAVHYHVIFFNLPYITKIKLRKIWGWGHIKIKKVESVKNVGFYVTKYLSKDFNDKRLKGRKCYFDSKELIKPTITCIEEVINNVFSQIPPETLEKEIKDISIKYLRSMDIARYNLKLYPKQKKELTDFIITTL